MKHILLFISFFSPSLFAEFSNDFQVKIFNEYTNKEICQGTQINRGWLLTAAHCFRNATSSTAYKVKFRNQSTQSVSLENIFSNSEPYDLALIKLNSIRLSKYTPSFSHDDSSKLYFSSDDFNYHQTEIYRSDDTYLQIHYSQNDISPGRSGSPIFKLVTNQSGRNKLALHGVLISYPGNEEASHLTFQKINREVISWIQDTIINN